MRRARRQLDVRFFWRLMEVLRAHLDDFTDTGRGEVAELSRQFYLDYLKRHGVTAP